MRIFIRIWNLTQALVGNFVSFFERKNPEALLQLEKENLRKLIGRFNEGLISHAALSERLMTQVSRGEVEQTKLTATINALVSADNSEAAARHALQLEQVRDRLVEDKEQLEAADETYTSLVRTRDSAVSEARANIEQVRRQIGDLKVKRAVADLDSMAASMVSEIGGAGDSFDRLREMVGEEREKASARARVASGTVSASELRLKEAEQVALAQQALQEFLSTEADGGPRLALPDHSEAHQTAAPRTKPKTTITNGESS